MAVGTSEDQFEYEDIMFFFFFFRIGDLTSVIVVRDISHILLSLSLRKIHSALCPPPPTQGTLFATLSGTG